MTKLNRSVRSFTEIAEIIAEETATTSDAFAEAFTETNLGRMLRLGMASHIGEVRLADLRPHAQAHTRRRKLLVTREPTGDETQVFLSRLRVARDYWTAVGAYHSPTGWRQRRYAIATAAKIKRRFGASAFSQTLHGHPIRSR